MTTATTSQRQGKRPTQLTVVLKPDELKRLEETAKREERTKSSMARLLIGEALEARAG